MPDEKDDKKELTGNEADAYKAGRTGAMNIIDTDSETEAAARERGEEAKIDAEETKKEEEEAKKDKDE